MLRGRRKKGGEPKNASSSSLSPTSRIMMDSEDNMAVWTTASEVSEAEEQPKAPLQSSGPVSRWKNFWIRTFWTVIMIGSFSAIMKAGHSYVVLMVVVLQTLVYKEVIAIAHVPSKEKKLPWFRSFVW